MQPIAPITMPIQEPVESGILSFSLLSGCCTGTVRLRLLGCACALLMERERGGEREAEGEREREGERETGDCIYMKVVS